jgi:CRP-like cAMP-binding protein
MNQVNSATEMSSDRIAQMEERLLRVIQPINRRLTALEDAIQRIEQSINFAAKPVSEVSTAAAVTRPLSEDKTMTPVSEFEVAEPASPEMPTKGSSASKSKQWVSDHAFHDTDKQQIETEDTKSAKWWDDRSASFARSQKKSASVVYALNSDFGAKDRHEYNRFGRTPMMSLEEAKEEEQLRAHYERSMRYANVQWNPAHEAEPDYSQIMSKFVLFHESLLHVIWDIGMMFLVVYYGFAVPMSIVFFASGDETEPKFLRTLDTVFNLLFVVDIGVNCITAYNIKDGQNKGELEVRQPNIFLNYLKTWLLIDVIASIPFDRFAGEQSTAARAVKLLRMVRVVRLVHKFGIYFRIEPAQLRLFMLCFCLFLLWHWIGCLYWLLASDIGLGTENCGDWCPEAHLDSASFAHKYSEVFFWALMVTTGIGKDIVPFTYSQSVFTNFATVTGVLAYASIVGTMANLVGITDKVNAGRNDKLNTIINYMRVRQVPAALTHSIVEYYEYLFSMYQTGKDEHEWLQDLHKDLKAELELSLSKNLLTSVPCFALCCEPTLLDISRCMSPRLGIPGEVICRQGQLGLHFWIIVRGMVMVEDARLNETAYASSNEFFGEWAVLTGRRRLITASCKTYVEMMELGKGDLWKLSRRRLDFAVHMERWRSSCRKIPHWTYVRHLVKLAWRAKRLRLVADDVNAFALVEVILAGSQKKARRQISSNVSKAKPSLSGSKDHQDHHQWIKMALGADYQEQPTVNGIGATGDSWLSRKLHKASNALSRSGGGGSKLTSVSPTDASIQSS